MSRTLVLLRGCCMHLAGTDMRMANYLLLALAIFQFPFSFWLAYRPV